MKTSLILSIISAAFLVNAHLHAQTFNSGSTGAYGAIDITADTTLPMPPDGIFNCTTINIAAGKTLKFARNALNTPVYLLATGNVTLAGIIDLEGSSGSRSGPTPGRGGPGGFDGGFAGFAGGAGSNGFGPGGGRTGPRNYLTYTFAATFAAAAGGNTAIYGNSALVPLIGGSGGMGGAGNPGNFGGGGGGAILIASRSHLINTTCTQHIVV